MTMQKLQTGTLLGLKNHNNKFACSAFIDINFAPDPDKIPTKKRYDAEYLIRHEGKLFTVKMVDYSVFSFGLAPTSLTIPATGLEGAEWQISWLKNHPNTTSLTQMACYCYQKIKE